MKMKRLIMSLIASAGVFALGTGALGQGLLDQQLGPKVTPEPTVTPAVPKVPGADGAADTKKDGSGTTAEKAPDAKSEPKDVPGGEIVSPTASKKVDDDELLNQLMQPGAKPDADAVAKRLHDMVNRMEDSAKRLTNKDPGEVTQETQRRIVSDLDVMIELAKQQQQQSSSSSSQQQQPGQARQPGQPQGGQQGPKGEGGTTAAQRESLPGGGYADPAKGDMRNYDPATWGGLPPRDRDQVSHGANEEYLTSYKDMIDRYYQALAEMGKTRNR